MRVSHLDHAHNNGQLHLYKHAAILNAGHSITDQVKNRFIAGRDFAAWKIGLSAAGGISGLAIAAIAVLLIWRRRQRQKSAPMERYKVSRLMTKQKL